MSCNFTAWEGVFLGWLLLCEVLAVIAKQRTALWHFLLGFLTYASLRAGTMLFVGLGKPYFAASAFGLLILGLTVFSGWMVSPGGLPFLLIPLRLVASALGLRGLDTPPFSTGNDSAWDRDSTKIALVTTATSLLFVFLYLVRRSMH